MKAIKLTDAGKALIAAAVGGEAAVNFTRIGTYGPEKNIVQQTPVSGVSRRGNLCEVFGLIDNSELCEGYSIEGLALFADNGGGEILFGECEENSDAFYMPAGNPEKSRTEVTLIISFVCGHSEKISLAPNSGAYASAVQLEEEIARLDEALAEKTDTKTAQLQTRLEVLETVLQSGSMENSTVLVFDGLDGMEFNGIWNFELQRIEF